METTKTARGYWKERFGEHPQNDTEKLACAMMQEYHTEQSTSQKEMIERLSDCLRKIMAKENQILDAGTWKSLNVDSRDLEEAEQLLSTTEPTS